MVVACLGVGLAGLLGAAGAWGRLESTLRKVGGWGRVGSGEGLECKLYMECKFCLECKSCMECKLCMECKGWASSHFGKAVNGVTATVGRAPGRAVGAAKLPPSKPPEMILRGT